MLRYKQNVSYYSEPKVMAKKASLDEVDPALLETFDKLGKAVQIESMRTVLKKRLGRAP